MVLLSIEEALTVRGGQEQEADPWDVDEHPWDRDADDNPWDVDSGHPWDD